MKIKRFFLTAAVLFLGACKQEPLFWYINQEYPPIDPIISGAPTEIVEVGGVGGGVYVANRESLWKYDSNQDQWKGIFKPPGAIIAIAATTTDLYVLVDGGTIHRSSDGEHWNPPVHISGAQKIYGANTKLFVGDGAAVYDYTAPSIPITGAGGLLRGAAWDGTAYYICTTKMWGNENTGIFTISGTTATSEYPGSFKGIIAAGSIIVAVTGDTIIYKDSGVYTAILIGVSFTGGMAYWEWTDSSLTIHKKILLGLQKNGSGTYRYGYREFDLDGLKKWNVYVPGNTDNGTRTTSIDPGSTETSAIGKHPVNALYVVTPLPGPPPKPTSEDSLGRPIIFASTQKDGVWSYRARRGIPQWNGEDNSTR
jgi:hypothetical protein